jgi:ABC-type sulfate/molybdate transport systems ATPase subunit
VLHAELRLDLRDVRVEGVLDVTAEQAVALVGRSGAGKTSLLRAIAGVLRPAAGTVRCGDEVWLDTARGVDLPADTRRCALLHQDDSLFPHLTAWRNVAFGLTGVPRGARREHATGILERFGVAHLADVRPGTLSGGERRRVALARALAARPPVLLLDEPFTGLDDRTRADVRSAVRDALAIARVPAIVVTHDHQDAGGLGARVVELRDGVLVSAEWTEPVHSSGSLHQPQDPPDA